MLVAGNIKPGVRLRTFCLVPQSFQFSTLSEEAIEMRLMDLAIEVEAQLALHALARG